MHEMSLACMRTSKELWLIMHEFYMAFSHNVGKASSKIKPEEEDVMSSMVKHVFRLGISHLGNLPHQGSMTFL